MVWAHGEHCPHGSRPGQCRKDLGKGRVELPSDAVWLHWVKERVYCRCIGIKRARLTKRSHRDLRIDNDAIVKSVPLRGQAGTSKQLCQEWLVRRTKQLDKVRIEDILLAGDESRCVVVAASLVVVDPKSLAR